MRSIESSGGALVSLDQPTEPFVADDLIEYDRLIFRRRIGTGRRQEISRRMRSLSVIIANVLTDEIVEVLLATDQEIVQAFVLDRLDHSFTTGIQVRALDRQHDRFDAGRLEDVIKLGGEPHRQKRRHGADYIHLRCGQPVEHIRGCRRDDDLHVRRRRESTTRQSP